MGKKYLETKGNSLESSILGMWEEEADRVDGRTRSYKEHRARLEARRLKAENKKKSMNEGSKEEYEKFFNSALKKFNIDSPADLKSDEEKKKFFNYVDKNYTGEKDEEFDDFIKEKMEEEEITEEEAALFELDDEEFDEAMKKKSAGERKDAKKKRDKYMKTAAGKASAKKAKKRAAKVRSGAIKVDKAKSKAAKKRAKLYSGDDFGEGLENSPNKANSQHLCAKNVVHEEWGEGHPVHGMHAIPNSEGEIAWYDVMFEHGIEKGVSINELNVIFETSHENHDKDDDDKKMLSAGKMSQLHQMIKDKKSAEEIAKAMKLDVKTVKALMSNYNMEELDLDEGTKQVLAHGGKGQYKAVKDGDITKIMYKGKVVGTADFDRGADSFMVSMKGQKGQKSFDDAQAMVDYFAKNKITEEYDLAEGKKYEHGIGKVNSAFEIGTPEYRQHTQSITPGQEITDYQQFKVQSMKEALAKVWGLDEAKKEEKDLTKKVKGSTITMTGKKSDEIDTKPEIKEK